MKKIFKVIATTLAASCVLSCSYLDMTPTDRVSDKTIWENTTNAEYGVNYIYTYIYNIYSNQCTAGLTEALTDQMKYGSYQYNSYCYIPSEISYRDESTLSPSFVDVYLGKWGTMYSYLRKTNQSIDALRKYGKMSQQDKTRLEGELRFMRAYIYTDLAKRYGDVIFYDENMKNIQRNQKLTPESVIWEFIENDLKFAADNLPEKASAKGRLDKGAAYAFMSRAMLYAKNWESAKNAATQVETLGYTLMSNYADSYQKTSNQGNTEIILQYLFDRKHKTSHNFDFYYSPGGDYYGRGESGGGYGTPTQEMVESYELKEGGFPDWTPWHSTEGTLEEPPYNKLEPRFQASILYNGSDWKGRKIEPFVKGMDGWSEWNTEREPMGRTTTGYYLRKGVDETHDVITESGSVQPACIIRFAEVLLNKAEACYNLGEESLANDLVKKIRNRVGLPYTAKAGDELWEAIRQERKVELAYEGLWYWDLRRWGVAHEIYPKGLEGYQQHGLKIEKVGGDFRYTYVSVDDQNRHFSKKMYRFPIPEAELNNNKDIDQFENWK